MRDGSTAITPTPTGKPLAVWPGRWYATASTTSVRDPTGAATVAVETSSVVVGGAGTSVACRAGPVWATGVESDAGDVRDAGGASRLDRRCAACACVWSAANRVWVR